MWCKKVIGYLEPCRSKLACALPYYCIIDYCFHVLRRGLVRAIRRKHPDVEIESLVFHQGNAPAHRALDPSWQSTFEGSNDSIIHHIHPISLQWIFAIFPKLKGDLRWRRFEGLNVRSRKRFELSQRTGFPRCTLNWLGNMKNVSRRRVNTSRKAEKRQRHEVVSVKLPCTYNGIWFVCIFKPVL